MQGVFVLLMSTTTLAQHNSNKPATNWPRQVVMPFRYVDDLWQGRNQPMTETEAVAGGWTFVEDGCAAGQSKMPQFPGRRYIKLEELSNAALDYEPTPRIVLVYANDGNLAGIQSVLPLEATYTVKETDAHYLNFTASLRYQPDEKLGAIVGKDVLVKTAYLGHPSEICYNPETFDLFKFFAWIFQIIKRALDSLKTPAVNNRHTSDHNVYLQNGATPSDLLSIPQYVGDALEDKDKGFKYIEHHEPDGSITMWYEHLCYPFMGVHWLPVEPNLSDPTCHQYDWDQGVYDPKTSKLIAFAFLHHARAKDNDSIKNIWLDYSGGKLGKSYEKLQLVWFAPTCLKDVETSTTHVFFGTKNFAVGKCTAPQKCNSLMNCWCHKKEGETLATSKCFCTSEGALSCKEQFGS